MSKLPNKATSEEDSYREPMNDGMELRYQEVYSSFPSAENIDAYEKHNPGTMKFLLDKYGEEQAHRHEIEKNESNCNIEATRAEIKNEKIDQILNFTGNLVGQIFSLAICLGAMIACYHLAMQEHTWESIAIASIPLAAIIRAIMKK